MVNFSTAGGCVAVCRSLAFKNSLDEPRADRNLPGSSSLQSFQAWLRRKGRDRAPASHCLTALMNMCMDESAMLRFQTWQSLCQLSPATNRTDQREYVSSSENASVTEVQTVIQTVFYFSTQPTSQFDIQSLIPDRSLFCCLYGIISNYSVPRNVRDSLRF